MTKYLTVKGQRNHLFSYHDTLAHSQVRQSISNVLYKEKVLMKWFQLPFVLHSSQLPVSWVKLDQSLETLLGFEPNKRETFSRYLLNNVEHLKSCHTRHSNKISMEMFLTEIWFCWHFSFPDDDAAGGGRTNTFNILHKIDNSWYLYLTGTIWCLCFIF